MAICTYRSVRADLHSSSYGADRHNNNRDTPFTAYRTCRFCRYSPRIHSYNTRHRKRDTALNKGEVSHIGACNWTYNPGARKPYSVSRLVHLIVGSCSRVWSCAHIQVRDSKDGRSKGERRDSSFIKTGCTDCLLYLAEGTPIFPNLIPPLSQETSRRSDVNLWGKCA